MSLTLGTRSSSSRGRLPARPTSTAYLTVICPGAGRCLDRSSMKVNVTPSTGMCSPARGLAEAVAHSRRALAIEPGDADAHNLGVVLALMTQALPTRPRHSMSTPGYTEGRPRPSLRATARPNGQVSYPVARARP